jgi:hypothetical protein
MVKSFDDAFRSRRLNYIGFGILMVVTMKTASSGMVKFYQTTRCQNLEDNTLQKIRFFRPVDQTAYIKIFDVHQIIVEIYFCVHKQICVGQEFTVLTDTSMQRVFLKLQSKNSFF